MIDFLKNIWEDFYDCFIDGSCYKLYLIGLRNTIFIALIACLLGLIIGIIVMCIRIAPKNNFIMRFLDGVCRLYVTIIRGTPIVLQLFIGYFIVFSSMKFLLFFGISNTVSIPIAGVVFGINSGAYMAEILRGGIMSVDKGQMEAGRSLGLSWLQTFFKIVLPQALKCAIPTMFNEFITLVKETSVAGYVGIYELTKVREDFTTSTMKLYMPLIIIACIYLVIVLGLQRIQKFLERRFARSERQ